MGMTLSSVLKHHDVSIFGEFCLSVWDRSVRNELCDTDGKRAPVIREQYLYARGASRMCGYS